MSRLMIKLVSLSLPVVIFLTGFAAPAPRLPDLVPVRHYNYSDPIAYCGLKQISGASHLVVKVQNASRFAAAASRTRVTFTSPAGGPVTVIRPTPALGPGRTTILYFRIPAACYQPDCHFRIMVDATNLVKEANERNNAAIGYCLG